MLLRKTTAADFNRVVEILDDGRASLARLGIDQWQDGRPGPHELAVDIARGESYVAVDADRAVVATAMVGFCGEETYRMIENGSWLTDGGVGAALGRAGEGNLSCSYAVIHRVAVAAGKTGSGAGSFLLGEAERLAYEHGCLSVRIDTHPGNVPMQKLLSKLGYTHCGTIFIDLPEGGVPERLAFEKLLVACPEVRCAV